MARSKLRNFHLIILVVALATSQAWASGLPNPLLTPGAVDLSVTQENIQSTVCVRGYTKTVRPPSYYTNKLKKMQVREYGYDDRNPKHYEEDHLIALSIGGNPRDPRNLWPEPRKGEWNASRKDDLEYIIYRMVCRGEIPLADAQREMASDWIGAYKKYVHEKGRSRKHKYGHVD